MQQASLYPPVVLGLPILRKGKGLLPSVRAFKVVHPIADVRGTSQTAVTLYCYPTFSVATVCKKVLLYKESQAPSWQLPSPSTVEVCPGIVKFDSRRPWLRYTSYCTARSENGYVQGRRLQYTGSTPAQATGAKHSGKANTVECLFKKGF